MAAAAIASTPLHTLPLRFADAFWDPNDRGINVIVQKLHNSKQTCEEIKKLYEIRSQIEEDYGDRLLKLSQLIVGQTEEGTLSESLSHIPSALETTARAHMDLAQQLKHHLEEPLDDFLQEQRDRRKQYQHQIEKAQQLKSMHHTNAIKAKEFYTAECSKVAGIEKYLRQCGPEMTREELHQTREEIEEGQRMMRAAEQEFKRAINTYNSATNDWIEIWRASCDTFQEMETQRIDYVHASLRSFATMMSSVCLVDDQCCERIRTTVDMTNSQQDIEEFITQYGTGGEVPELMKFETFMGMDLRTSPAPSYKQVPEEPKQKEIPKTFEVYVGDDATKDGAPQAGEDSVEVLEIGQAPKAESSDAKSNKFPAKPESIKAVDNDSDSDDYDDDVEVGVLEAMTFHRTVEDTNEEPGQKDEAPAVAVIVPAAAATTAASTHNDDAVISAIQEIEELLRAKQTYTESAMNETSDDELVSVSPKEPSAPPTPPLLVPVMVTLPEKDKPVPPVVTDKEPVVGHDDPVLVPEAAPPAAGTAPPTRDLDADSTSTVAANVIPTTASNTEPVPLPPVRIEISTPDLTHEDPKPVVPGHTVLEPPPKETHAPSVSSVTASISSIDQVASEARPRSLISVVIVQPSDFPPNTNVDDDGSDDDNESDKEYPAPPPKGEKWVISSTRQVQQLPVRVRQARMSMVALGTPSFPSALDLDHGDFRAPSTSTGYKFSRPNAPIKIEIPNKIASSSAVSGIQTNSAALATTHNQQEQQEHPHTGPQTAAQQVIAAGRALAHQTSAWQSSVTSTPNRRFSSFDAKHYQDYHRSIEPIAEQCPLYEVEDELSPRKSLDSRLDSNASSNSTHTKKSHHLSTFVKGVLKPENLVPKQQPSATLSVEKPTKEKNRGRRFSMNIFGGKKEKQRNKHGQQLEPLDDPVIPIFEDTEMYNGSRSTPLLRPSSLTFVNSQQHHSLHNLYQQSQRQVQDQLEDGTPVIEYVRAIWTYEAKMLSELSFMSGDGLAVISKQIDGWWLAELMDPQRRKRGLVPGNYMEAAMM